jgi:hypothetical protein
LQTLVETDWWFKKYNDTSFATRQRFERKIPIFCQSFGVLKKE